MPNLSHVPVEVALATYNGERYIRAQMDSIFAQSHQNFTVVASDDGSTDTTVAVLQEYAERHPGRVRIVRTGGPRLGVKGNFSALLPHLTAEYVFFCDQDDVWLPWKIARTLALLAELEPGAPPETPLLAHTDLAVVDEELGLVAASAMQHQNIDPSRDAFPLLLLSNVATGCTVAVNRALCRIAARVPPEAMMHDHWLVLVAASLGRVGYLDEPTVLYRQHGRNTLGARPWNTRNNIARVRDTLFGAGRREVLARYSRQAAVFLACYGDVLRPEDRRAAAALANVGTAGRLDRFWPLVRHRVLLKGVLRNAALLYIVALRSARTPGE